MNRDSFLGGSPLAVILRLVLISIVVGIVLSTLSIDLSNVFYRLNVLLRNLYELGLGAFDSVLGYLLLGGVVVVPIWLVSRLIATMRKKDS